MATFYLIRHWKPDYTYGDTHGFIGQGHDFAPLKDDGIKYVIETSKDTRLKNAQIIVASPYTRALQTASIISKETGIEIAGEPDIREWQPDLTYQYKSWSFWDYFLNGKPNYRIIENLMTGYFEYRPLKIFTYLNSFYTIAI